MSKIYSLKWYRVRGLTPPPGATSETQVRSNAAPKKIYSLKWYRTRGLTPPPGATTQTQVPANWRPPRTAGGGGSTSVVYPTGYGGGDYSGSGVGGLFANGTGPDQDGGKHVSNATLAERRNSSILSNLLWYGSIAVLGIGLVYVTRRFHLLSGGKKPHGHAHTH